MKNTTLHFPAKFTVLVEDEMICIDGGAAIEDAWNIIEATVTGLASAGADVIGSVMRGEIGPVSAICSSLVYLAGNVVASIIWILA